MKTICVLDGRVIMSQDGDALKTMTANAAQHPGAVASVVTDGEYIALVKKQPKTVDELQTAVQSHLDAKAREKGYDSILSACSYAAALNPFQAEGAAYLKWRGAVWAKCIAILADVKAGIRPVPTEAALIAELPPLVLP